MFSKAIYEFITLRMCYRRPGSTEEHFGISNRVQLRKDGRKRRFGSRSCCRGDDICSHNHNSIH